jgi:hypothetical protein
MEQDEHIVLGMREQWGQESPFVLPNRDRRHHLYAIGKSGTGKTTLLQNLILQDIYAGRGVGVIDPHGDLASHVIEHIPKQRIEDVAYFNPADLDHPIGFNLLRARPRDHRHLVASGIVNVFQSLWKDYWGPRLEYILYASVAALLECDNVSMLGIQRMLWDDRYRSWVVRQVQDPMVRSFWVNEFEGYNSKFLQEAVAPIQNKVGQLLMSSHLRNILGQARNRLEARFMMDEGRILIADVSKGKLGADKARLLGALLITQFELAAMSRADIPEETRRDFHLYIDEFPSFTSETFASLLSEARKYRLCLTLAHQYVGQLRPDIREAVFGNVGSMVVFRLGQADAEVIGREFGEAVMPRQFVDLGNHQVFAKVLNDGEYGESFLGRTLPPAGMRYGKGEVIIRRSREKFASRREVVEAKIKRWMGR